MEEILDFFIFTRSSYKGTSSNSYKIKLFRTRPDLQRAFIPQAHSVPQKDAWSPGGFLLPQDLCTVIMVHPKSPSCQEGCAAAPGNAAKAWTRPW